MFPEKNTFFLQKSSFDLTLTHSEISLKISAVDLWNGNLMIRKIGVSNFICFVELEKRSIEMGRYGSYLENHNFGQRKAIQRRLEISGYGSALPDKPLMLDEWIRGLPSRKCEHVSAIWSAPLKIGPDPNRNISGWTHLSICSTAALSFYYPCAISTYL